MIRSFAIVAAACALAVPMSAAAADADPVFDAFQSICWDTAGDYLASVKAADTGGWKDTDVVADTEAGLSVTDKAAREKQVGNKTYTVFISRGLRHISTGDVKEQSCKLVVNKPDNALVGEGQSWVGVAPDAGDPTLAVYYVKLAPGKPDHLGKDGINAAMAAGGFGILKFQQDSDSGIVVYQGYSK
jgi:hypothetical protein